jgi:hypothetical protein
MTLKDEIRAGGPNYANVYTTLIRQMLNKHNFAGPQKTA